MISGMYNSYEEYIHSDIWRTKVNELIKLVRHCQVCGRSKYIYSEDNENLKNGKPKQIFKDLPLTVHHKTYENVGNEPKRDLLVVCHNCHNKIHKK